MERIQIFSGDKKDEKRLFYVIDNNYNFIAIIRGNHVFLETNEPIEKDILWRLYQFQIFFVLPVHIYIIMFLMLNI
jgi:hypothetical protein